jgi:parallel beta-helix repeat protein
MAQRGRYLLAFLAFLAFLAWLMAAAIFITADAATVQVEVGDSIQAALEAAGRGDVIEVVGGVYRESLNITEQVTLIGVGRPLIDAGAGRNGLTISADGVVVSGFDVRSSRRVGIDVLSSSNLIKNCSIHGCADGIRLPGIGNSIVLNNISNNTNGISLIRSDDNIIKYNDIDYNTGDGSDCGIFLLYSEGNTISHNNLTENGDCAISLRKSSNNTILANNISGDNWYGISLEEFSNGNIVEGNYARASVHGGIYLDSSRGNTLRGNAVQENGQGIFLSYDSNDNLVEGNTASNNDKGIHLAYHSSNNTVKDNVIVSNQYGIYLTFSSGWNSIFNNRLIDNLYNAYDMGLYNLWDNGSIGNYYSDLGSVVYIPGGAGIDRHPLGGG